MGITSQINNFFEEFKDSPSRMNPFSTFNLILFVILLGVYSNFRGNPDIAFACLIYLVMQIYVAVTAQFDMMKESVLNLGFVASGKWAYYGLVPLIIGGIFGFFIVSQSQSIGLSFLQLTGLSSFFFVVIIAPFVEESFFRCAFFPTVNQSLKSFTSQHAIVALLVANIAFGLFHWYVYGANPAAVIVAIALGIIYTIGNYALKSCTFSMGAHIVNNYLLWAAAGGVLFG